MRVKVLEPIEFNGSQLAAGRILRVTDDSLPALREKYGSAIAEWPSWPDPSTDPEVLEKEKARLEIAEKKRRSAAKARAARAKAKAKREADKKAAEEAARSASDQSGVGSGSGSSEHSVPGDLEAESWEKHSQSSSSTTSGDE